MEEYVPQDKSTSTLLLSDEAYRALLTVSEHGFPRSSSERTRDGWIIEVGFDTIDELREMKLPGEDYNDVIIRMAAAYNAKGRMN